MALVPLNDMTPNINSRRRARLRHFPVELRGHWGATKARRLVVHRHEQAVH
jgi:hypothetical protein